MSSLTRAQGVWQGERGEGLAREEPRKEQASETRLEPAPQCPDDDFDDYYNHDDNDGDDHGVSQERSKPARTDWNKFTSVLVMIMMITIIMMIMMVMIMV